MTFIAVQRNSSLDNLAIWMVGTTSLDLLTQLFPVNVALITLVSTQEP